MPPAKGFFKTLLRKGKSKHEVSAPESEPADQTHHQGGSYSYDNDEHHSDYHDTRRRSRSHADEEVEQEVEGKLPKEFLDTWVSSTTHQLMDEMDQALKGVWPYDKKEDSLSGYRRRSSSNEHLTGGAIMADHSQTTLKRRSKHQVPSSARSDRGGSDSTSSTFILKEKTKKTSSTTANGSLRNAHSHYKSNSSLHSQTLQPPAPSTTISAVSERRSSGDGAVTEADGSASKEQFLQKLQQDSPSQHSAGTLKKKSGSSEILNAAPFVGSKDQRLSAEILGSRGVKNGRSASTSSNGPAVQSTKNSTSVAHGRQSSVPGSTYSGSSSGQSGNEFRGREELLEGKTSSLHVDSGYESGTVRSRKQEMLPLSHHQGLNGDGERGRYEYDTLRPRKDEMSMSSQPRGAGYDSSTLRARREPNVSADYATLKRVKRSPTLSLTSRSTPRGSNSAIDSVPLCFDQLTAMNVSTLQQLCAIYLHSQKCYVTERQQQEEQLPLCAEDGSRVAELEQKTLNGGATNGINSTTTNEFTTSSPSTSTSASTSASTSTEISTASSTTATSSVSSYRWYDIGLMDEGTPLFASTKVVLYTAYWRTNPNLTFTVMLSLKPPAKLQSFKPNLLTAATTFEAEVAAHLIPASLYVGQKMMKSQAAVSKELSSPFSTPAVATPGVPAPPRTPATPRAPETPGAPATRGAFLNDTPTAASSKTNSIHIRKPLVSQRSIDDSLLQSSRHHASSTFVHSISLTGDSTTNTRGVFTNQTKQDLRANIEAEQAAVNSILMAVAGEEERQVLSDDSERLSPAVVTSENGAKSVLLFPEVSSHVGTSLGSPSPSETSTKVSSHVGTSLGSPSPSETSTKVSSHVGTSLGSSSPMGAFVSVKKSSLGTNDKSSAKSQNPAWDTLPEPVKLASRFEAFSSAVKKPIAERYPQGRTADLLSSSHRGSNIGSSNNSSSSSSSSRRNLSSVDKIIPGLKAAGLVRNRIANLNSSNNNNCDNEDEDEDDDEDECLDTWIMNTNNNNNLDDMIQAASSESEGDFVFASHLMEMAGGELYHPIEEETEDNSAKATSVGSSRGAAVRSRVSCADKVSTVQSVTCYVTVLPALPKVETIKSYIERLMSEERETVELEMDVIFVLLQMLNVIFGLHESQLRLDSISMSDFLVVTDSSDISTVHCHMVNVTQSSHHRVGLTCEKLRMFLMQISHLVKSLQKSVLFTTVEDLIQNSEDLGDLKTIYAILQYLLWGPKDDEVKVITLAEHRRQAFELWLQLARGKLLSGLALKPIDNLKAFMVTNFLANSNGSELFKITKLLNTY